jgi:hypothetical protein
MHYLQSVSGEIAQFEMISDDIMAFICNKDIVELNIVDARKVWRAFRICQWQPIDREALELYRR